MLDTLPLIAGHSKLMALKIPRNTRRLTLVFLGVRRDTFLPVSTIAYVTLIQRQFIRGPVLVLGLPGLQDTPVALQSVRYISPRWPL